MRTASSASIATLRGLPSLSFTASARAWSAFASGFTSTRGYIKNLKEPLPEYIDKCLHIYDAVDYAENAFNVPVIAYSGEKDAQKAAADNIERLLKGFKEPAKFSHLIAPGLKHEQPKDWQDKVEAEVKTIVERALANAQARGNVPVGMEITSAVYQASKCVLQDVWDPAVAARLIAAERCTIGMR